MIIVHKKVNKKICTGLTWREYKCQCSYKECTSSMIDEKFIEAYTAFREHVGTPLHITSGYRCQRWNAKAGGVKTSRHKAGCAIDIAFTGGLKFLLPETIIKIAEASGFNFVKYYKTKKFFHLEV